MQRLFGLIEPLPNSEILVRYWHFLRSLDEPARSALGPITLIVESEGSIRGWPVGFKNQMLALSTESQLSPKCAVVFVDLNRVIALAFSEVHKILPFITAGAVSRSPHEQKPTRESSQKALLQVCEDLRKELPAKIFFDQDPIKFDVDVMLNVCEVLRSLTSSIASLKSSRIASGASLNSISGLHIVQSLDATQLSIVLNADGELELTFNFSRALPSNLSDQVYSLISSIV